MYMIYAKTAKFTGLDMNATGAQISKLINESGLNDKKLSEIMHLSVQCINKWRHGHSLPDIENLFILSRILGKRVDDFLVPLAVNQPAVELVIETRQDSASRLSHLKEYAIRLKALFNSTLNDKSCGCI